MMGRYSKRIVGSLAGNGVVPMGSERARPSRQSAIGTAFADDPTPYFGVAGLLSGTATIKVDTGAAVVTVQGANGSPTEASNWSDTGISVALDGGAGVGDSELVSIGLGFEYIRFVVSGSDAARTVEVVFLGHEFGFSGQAAGGSAVSLKGSTGWVDERGLHAERPAADARPTGTTYWSVDEPSAPGTVYVTDGSSWSVVAAL